MSKVLSLLDNIINLIDNNPSRMNSKPVIDLYTSWFCPFAQRAWMAIELKQIPYKRIEVDPYNKSKEWLSINPRGLVPTIVHNNKSIYESTIILEYLNDEFKEYKPILYPIDNYKKALNRIWIDHISKKVIRHFYEILQFNDEMKRAEAVKTYVSQLSLVFQNMNKVGPYFNGNECMAIDLILIPWISRHFILKYYKNVNIPTYFDNDILQRYNLWWNACNNLDAYKATKADDNDLIGIYKRYADNVAQSQVAVAVNTGLAMP